MANILILQEGTGALEELQRSLAVHHLLFVPTAEEAMTTLGSGSPVDLIITRVHLEESNPFQFLHLVKGDARYAHIPIVCFSGRLTEQARLLDPTLAQSALVVGADSYVSLEDFCSAEGCDYGALQKAFEAALN